MRKNKTFTFLFLLINVIVFLEVCSAATNINNCTNLTTAGTYYQLNASINNDTITGDCISITSANITLDCLGNSISSTQNVSGVYSNQVNTTIKNCNITMGSGVNAQAMGIELTDAADNSTILNNTILGNMTNGIYTAAEYGLFENNTVNMSGSGTMINLVGANDNTFNNNTLFSIAGNFYTDSLRNKLYYNKISGNTNQRVARFDGGNNLIINNTFNSYAGTYAIYIATNNNTITGNNATSTTSFGILLYGSSAVNNTLTGNIGISGNGGTVGGGISVQGGANNNTLINNTGIGGSSYGFHLLNAVNNTIINNTFTSNSSYGIYVDRTPNTGYNTFINTNATGYLTNSYGIGFRDANHTLIKDCINMTGISGDVLFVTTTSLNVTFVNCSYRITGNNETVLAGGTLVRKWYYRAYVNDTAGNPANNANISAYNSSNSAEFEGLMTNASGWTNIITITEYVNSAGTRTYYSNYTINATNTTHRDQHSYNVNVSLNNLNDVFSFDATSPIITIISPVNNSNFNTSTVIFNLSGNENLSWCGLSIDNGANVIMTLNSSLTGANYTNSSMTNALHNFTISCNDTSGNIGTSARYFVLNDLTYPQINFTGQTPANDSGQSANAVFVNVSSSDNLGEHSVVMDWNNSLVFWMRMDDVNSSGDPVEYFGRANASKGTGNSQTNAGKFGKAFSINYTGAAMIVPNSASINPAQNFTVILWASVGTNAGTRALIDKRGGGTGYDLLTSGNWRVFNSSGSGVNVASGLANNIWIFYTLTYNGTNAVSYKNGIRQAISNLTGNINGTANLAIGQLQGGGNMNGTIDDVQIYNRVLSATEINASFNANSYKYANNFTNLNNVTYSYKAYSQDLGGNVNSTELRYVTVDATNPNASLLTPANNSYANNGTQNFTANLSDNNGIKNATLNIYNSSDSLINSTNVSFASGVVQSVTGIVVTLVEGVYKWFYDIFDWAGNSAVTSNYTITVDTVNPLINFTAPTPANDSGQSNGFYVNVTITEINLANITWNWNGTRYVYNTSNNNITSLANSNFSFNITSIGSNNWNLNVTQYNLLTGVTYTYNISVSDSAGNVNSTETRTIKGNSKPTFVFVRYIPNATADVDPNIMINITVNISEADMNFDSAILQWKNTSADWNQSTNVTMINLTSKSGAYILMNSNFSLPIYEDNITFRIWANDSVGDSNLSLNYSLVSYWDCNWTSTSTLGASVGWNQNKFIGNITINNTGDPAFATNNCSLDFRLTYDLTEGRIYYDTEYVKPSNTYTISANSSRNISINTTFGNEIKQENAVITTSEFRARSLTSSINTTATLVTNQIGPYLYQSVISYPSSVYLTPGNFSLQGYIRNLMGSITINETNTAYNVSLNWTLISGLTNVSGNLSVNYTNLTDNNLNYNNIEVGFLDLASFTSGVKTFYLYSLGYNSSGSLIDDVSNNTLLTNAINVSFLCYNTSDSVCVASCGYSQDPDCTQATSGTTSSSGGGGSGGGGVVEKQEKSDAIFELVNGHDSEFKLLIDNKWSNLKKNIKISVSGINANYISVEPNEIDSIEAYSGKNITIKITAPGYFTSGNYTLIFNIKGEIFSNETSSEKFTEIKRVTLNILDLSRESADRMMNDSLELLNEMNESNFSIKEVQSLYNEIVKNYNALDFKTLENNYNSLKLLRDSAFNAKNIINELEIGIKDAEKRGISVIESKKLLYLAQMIFNRGDYNLALGRLKEAKLTYAIETKGEFNLLYEMKNHPVSSAASILVLLLVSIGGTIGTGIFLLKRKLKLLIEEEQILLELMKVVQRECFEKNRMSMEEYEQTMAQYELRLGEVIQERITIESRLVHIMRLNGNRGSLFDEKKRITDLVRNLQDLYLNKAKIETRVYENMLKTYSKRLAEIEEQLIFLDAQDALNENKWGRRLLKLVRLSN